MGFSLKSLIWNEKYIFFIDLINNI
jgi:hypothetical protein